MGSVKRGRSGRDSLPSREGVRVAKSRAEPEFPALVQQLLMASGDIAERVVHRVRLAGSQVAWRTVLKSDLKAVEEPAESAININLGAYIRVFAC